MAKRKPKFNCPTCERTGGKFVTRDLQAFADHFKTHCPNKLENEAFAVLRQLGYPEATNSRQLRDQLVDVQINRMLRDGVPAGGTA